jgi:hypothetical protein
VTSPTGHRWPTAPPTTSQLLACGCCWSTPPERSVAAYEAEKENWLRNLSAARAARVRALLEGDQVDVDASEAILGYRLRQHHVGVVCWLGDDDKAAGGALTRLEQATTKVAGQAACEGRPVFLPQDESCAWAWLPLGARDTFAVPPALSSATRAESGIRFAFGAPGAGVAGFRRTHRQALGAQAVALAAGPAGRRLTTFAEVAPPRPDGELGRAPATLGPRNARVAGRRRRPARQAARHPARLPAGERQLQGHRRAAHPAQEQRPVPGPQGRGGPRPSPRRAPPAGGTGPAGKPLARPHRPSTTGSGPATTDRTHSPACQPTLSKNPDQVISGSDDPAAAICRLPT